MKKELKQLYCKDKKLAVQVAGALGYKIKAQPVQQYSGNPEQTKKQILKGIKKIPAKMKKVNKKIEDIEKRINKGKLEGKLIDTLFVISNINRSLENMLSQVQTELRF